MTVEYFAIRDSARRKATPCAFMRYTDETGFEIDIDSGVSADEVPAFFVPFVEKEERRIDGDLALRWVRERVPPPGRQNLGEILDAHGLSEYSELALLRAGRGESSQDSFVVEEIDEASYESGRVDRTAQRRQKLGQEIKARRMGLDMSQRELADAVGIDQPALSRIEAGKANVTFDLLADIDEVLSGDSRPMLSLARRVLWNAERRELHELIRRCAPSLAQVYKRLIDELEAYSEDAVSAVADSRIISHSFREFMNAFPNYVDESMLQKSTQGREYVALNKLYPLLEELPPDDAANGTLIPISSELHRVLIDLRTARDVGSYNSIQRMRIAVSGVKNDPTVPISAWREAKILAEKTAHFPRGEDGEVPEFYEYLDSLFVLEKALKVRLGNIYDAKDELFRIIEKTNRIDSEGNFAFPSKAEVTLFVSMLGDINLHMAAFRELKNPYWLEALDQESFFDSYSNLGEDDHLPFPAAPYLMHCLAFENERVVDLLTRLSKSGWPFARGLLIEVANKLPIRSCVEISRQLVRWAKEGYGVGTVFWFRSDVIDLVDKMLRCADADIRQSGFALFQHLVHLRQRQAESHSYEKVEACLPDFAYENCLEKIMPLLSLEEQLTIARNMLNQYVTESEKARGYSFTTRIAVWSVRDDALERSALHEEYLVSWIRAYKKAVFEMLTVKPEMITQIVSKQRPLVMRILMCSIHDYLEMIEDAEPISFIKEALAQICLNDEILFDDEYEVELMPLFVDFARFAEAEHKERFFCSFLGWLDAWEKKRVQHSQSSEETEFYKRQRELFEHAYLSVFEIQELPEYLQKIKREREDERGEYDGPRPLYKAEVAWGPNSPKDVDELKEIGPKETLSWLSEWTPSPQDTFMLIEHEGVSRMLARLIKQDPFFFDGFSSELKVQKPVYVSGILDGWQNALKSENSIPVEDALGLCSFMLSDDCAKDEGAFCGYESKDDGAYQIQRHMAWLLNALLESPVSKLSVAAMHSVLMLLLDLRKRGLAKAQTGDDWSDEEDPVTASLNALSSIALTGILLWVLRDEEKCSSDMEFAFEALDDALPDTGVSKADVAAFALKMRGLLVDNRTWLGEKYERLFGKECPTENQRLFLALQISAFNANGSVHEFLDSAIEDALENGVDKYPATWGNVRLTNFAEHLGFWFYQLYAVGFLDLYDETLKKWETEVRPTTVGNVLGEICDMVRYGSDTTSEIAYRVRLLWDNLAKRAQDNLGILHGAFSLAASHLFSPDWLRKALLEEAHSHNVVSEFTVFFDDVSYLAREDPEWGIALLRAVLESDEEKELYHYETTSRSLIKFYRDAGGAEDDENLRFCMDVLGRMGMLDLDGLN